MSPEQFTAVITALTALVGAVVALVVQVRAWKKEINSRMTELLELTATSSRAEGRAARGNRPRERDTHSS